MASRAEHLVSKLSNVKRMGKGWQASCPVSAAHKHGDKHPSLKIDPASDGRVLVHCHAGCNIEDVCAAVGVELADLFPETENPKGILLETYDYTDEVGQLLFQVCRYFPKTFSQRRPDGKGGWVETLRGVQARPLFRLPKVVEAVRRGIPVVVVEGERDALVLEAMGKVATTCPGGAGKWREEHTEALRGAKVRVVTDTDEAGRKHADQVVASLREVASEVTAWEPTKGKDIREHLRSGGTIEELVPLGTAKPKLEILQGGKPDELVDVARDGENVVGEASIPELGAFSFEASQIRSTRTGRHAKVQVFRGIGANASRIAFDVINTDRDASRRDLSSSAGRALGESRWGPVAASIKIRLDAFCDSYWPCFVAGSEGEWTRGSRDDRPTYLLEPYLLKAGGTILFGPPGATKSYIAMIWALGLSHGTLPWRYEQTPVLLVNLERDAGSVSWRTACISNVLGVPARLLVINRRGYTLSHVHEAVLSTVRRHGAGLVIVDSLSRAGTGSLTDDEDSNRAMDMLNALGVAWCILAHTPRADTTHEYGSVMQSAAADRTVRCVSSTDRENRKAGVQLEVIKANDRGRPPAEVFTLSFDENDDLQTFSRAARSEWPDLTSSTATPETIILDYLREEGRATTSGIATETGLATNHVRAICGRSDRIVRVDGGGGRGNETVWGRVTPRALTEEG